MVKIAGSCNPPPPHSKDDVQCRARSQLKVLFSMVGLGSAATLDVLGQQPRKIDDEALRKRCADWR